MAAGSIMMKTWPTAPMMDPPAMMTQPVMPPMPCSYAYMPMSYGNAYTPLPQTPMPYGNGYAQMPYGNGYAQMPYGNGYAQMPYGNAYAPMPYGNTIATMPYSNTYAPMPYGNTYAPITYGNGYTPMPQPAVTVNQQVFQNYPAAAGTVATHAAPENSSGGIHPKNTGVHVEVGPVKLQMSEKVALGVLTVAGGGVIETAASCAGFWAGVAVGGALALGAVAVYHYWPEVKNLWSWIFGEGHKKTD